MNRIFYALFVLMIVFVTACNRGDDVIEEPEKHYDFPLSEEDLNWIPFQVGDVFRMKHNKGFITTFTLEEVSSGTSILWPPIYHYEGPYLRYEGRNYSFTSDFPDINLQMYLGKQYKTQQGTAINYLRLKCFVEGTTFPLIDHETIEWGADVYIFDSVFISGKWRRNVILSERKRSTEPEAIFADKLWYNAEEGFLKIVYTNLDSLVVE